MQPAINCAASGAVKVEEKVGRCICSSLQRYIFYYKNTDDDDNDDYADDIKEDVDDGGASAQPM